jgi:hypothetical protein
LHDGAFRFCVCEIGGGIRFDERQSIVDLKCSKSLFHYSTIVNGGRKVQHSGLREKGWIQVKLARRARQTGSSSGERTGLAVFAAGADGNEDAAELSQHLGDGVANGKTTACAALMAFGVPVAIAVQLIATRGQAGHQTVGH